MDIWEMKVYFLTKEITYLPSPEAAELGCQTFSHFKVAQDFTFHGGQTFPQQSGFTNLATKPDY